MEELQKDLQKPASGSPKNYLLGEIKRKIMHVATLEYGGDTVYKVSVKMFTPYYTAYKHDTPISEIVETPENVFWMSIFVKEDLLMGRVLQKGKYIVAYGYIHFDIYNNRLQATMTALEIKDIFTEPIKEKNEPEGLSNIPF